MTLYWALTAIGRLSNQIRRPARPGPRMRRLDGTQGDVLIARLDADASAGSTARSDALGAGWNELLPVRRFPRNTTSRIALAVDVPLERSHPPRLARPATSRTPTGESDRRRVLDWSSKPAARPAASMAPTNARRRLPDYQPHLSPPPAPTRQWSPSPTTRSAAAASTCGEAQAGDASADPNSARRVATMADGRRRALPDRRQQPRLPGVLRPARVDRDRATGGRPTRSSASPR